MQPLNELSGIFVMPPTIVSVSPLATEPVNAAGDIVVTVESKLIFVKAAQFANAAVPIDVTLAAEITRPFKAVQPLNELSGIFVMPPTIVSVLPLATEPVNAPAEIVVIVEGKLMFVNAKQFLNAVYPIDITPCLIIAVVKAMQSLNAPSSYTVTVSGIPTEVNLLQLINVLPAIVKK